MTARLPKAQDLCKETRECLQDCAGFHVGREGALGAGEDMVVDVLLRLGELDIDNFDALQWESNQPITGRVSVE